MAKGKKRRGRGSRSRRNGTVASTLGLKRRRQGNPDSRSLRLEPLEDRRMLAVFVVNNFADLDINGAPVVGSLRQAVQEANETVGRDTIMFADFLFDGVQGSTIQLSGGDNSAPLMLTDISGVDIIGPGPAAAVDGLEPLGRLTISAGGPNRVFLIDDGNEEVRSSVTISGVTLSGGSPAADDEDGRGGAILNREFLTLNTVELSNNFAPGGGGGVHNDTGVLRVENSLIRENVSQQGGGGVQSGIAEQDDNLPTTTIINSTITGNTAIGVPMDDMPTGYGGGVLNLAGTVNIEQSTIYGNTSPDGGGGVASQGFDPMVEEESMMPTVMSGNATTNIRSSIIVGNTSRDDMGMIVPNDVGSSGMTEGDEGADPPEEPGPFDWQINSLGYNLFGEFDSPPMTSNPDITLPGMGPGGMPPIVTDLTGVGPTTLFVDDPNQMTPMAWLNDFGGVLPVFMPDINKVDAMLGVNAAIDRGDPGNVVGDSDQRGFGFVRAADLAGSMMPPMDIGAAEVQLGNFEVNTLVDESDGRYSDVPVSEGTFPLNQLTFVPDFSLREALEFNDKNALAGLTGIATISFSPNLSNSEINPDPTPSTPAPTIQLTQGELFVTTPVNIAGPTLFELEVDAGGNDLTPTANNGDGSRVFTILAATEISNLILLGGDSQEFGGAILNVSDLTLRNATVTENFTTGAGGAIYTDVGSLTVDSSAILDSVSAGSGGGIFLETGSVTINNSTISGNTGTFIGGGIANSDGTLLIRYSTITENTAASTLGSGVASYRDGYASTEVRSSIISGNTVNDVQHVMAGANNIVSLGYNLVGDGNAVLSGVFSAPGDQSFADAMLAPIARLGGPTPVHRLLPGSPAIDAGDPNNAGLGNVPTQDQRGFPFDRIENDVRIDIGAFEVQEDVLLVGDIAMDPDAAFATFFEALEQSNLTPADESIVFLPSWPGEIFPTGILEITDSVEIIGVTGSSFFGLPVLDVAIDDGDDQSLLDVSISNLRFEDDVRISNSENLTLSNMQFVDNSTGAIVHDTGMLMISDSNFIGNSSFAPGGAIQAIDGDVQINNSFISGSSTNGTGGAIYLKDGTLTANYLYLTGNSAPDATGMGGGIYADNSTVMLTNATISGNSTIGSNSDGGAIAAKNSDITLIDSSVAFNTTLGSQSSGGAIFLDGGSLNIQRGNLSLNKTFGQSSSGGAIASMNADVTITGASLSRNEANGVNSHGGAIYSVGGGLTIRDSSVTTNKVGAAGANGGGIYSDTNLAGANTALVINSTVSGNTATHRGGGIYQADGLLQIKHSTITENSVPYFGNGAGVASFGNSATTRTEVSSSIIAGNLSSVVGTAQLPNPNGDVDSVGGLQNSFESLGYNVIGSGVQFTLDEFTQVGDQRNVLDPGLAALAIDVTTLTFFHDLLESSLAINAGDPNAVAGVGDVPTSDQIGADRVRRGRIDVGAIESNFVPQLPADFDGDNDVDGTDFLAWQRGFGTISGATKSDGDANGDGAVNGVDLAIWNSAYGTGGSIALAAASGDGGGSQLAALTASEPSEAVAVLDADTPPTGLALATVVFDTEQAGAAIEADQQASATSALDQSFAAYAQSSVSMDYDELLLESQEEASAEQQLEVTVEDEIFAWLGS